MKLTGILIPAILSAGLAAVALADAPAAQPTVDMPKQGLRASDVSSVTFRLAQRVDERTMELGSPVPGTRYLWLLADFKMSPGWHIYWLNPGDSGIPTNLKIVLPHGVYFAGYPDTVAFPIPQKFAQPGGFVGYGYEESVTLAVPLSVHPDAKGTIDISAIWLVCKDVCLSGHFSAKVDLNGPIGPPLRNADLSLPVGTNGNADAAFVVSAGWPKLNATDPKTLHISLPLRLTVGYKITEVFPLPAEDTELTVVKVTNGKQPSIDLVSTSYATPTYSSENKAVITSKVLVVLQSDKERKGVWVEFPAISPIPTTQPSSTIPPSTQSSPDVGR